MVPVAALKRLKRLKPIVSTIPFSLVAWADD